ncbi:hypothetical protein LguiA_005105 [Lonicera macranthoides]
MFRAPQTYGQGLTKPYIRQSHARRSSSDDDSSTSLAAMPARHYSSSAGTETSLAIWLMSLHVEALALMEEIDFFEGLRVVFRWSHPVGMFLRLIVSLQRRQMLLWRALSVIIFSWASG